MYQVSHDYRRSKAYRIAVPCTTPVTVNAAEAAVALNQQARGAQYINVLRKRAACKGPPMCRANHENDPAFMVTPAQMTLDFIMEERERELSGEYLRWTDSRRPGKAHFLNRIRA